jgi:hypothetical protein
MEKPHRTACKYKLVYIALQSLERLGYAVGRPGLDFLKEQRFFPQPPRPDRLWGPHRLLANVYKWVKRPGLEVNHTPPSSVEVKNTRSFTSTPPYVFMAWYLVKQRDNFTLPLTVRPPERVPVQNCISGKLRSAAPENVAGRYKRI